MSRFTIALAGNPNCGKTTIFNALTGSRQRVGNWPGVTVERLEGSYRDGGDEVCVVDLPGIYSFSAFATDEKISREYILMRKPDVVVNIVDATNLERNLYLTTQLLEMKVPVLVALNMVDLAAHRGIKIEVPHLERHLGCVVVPVVATQGTGLDALKASILRVARERSVSSTQVTYHPEVEEAIALLEKAGAAIAEENRVHPRWLAIKLLEKDELAASFARQALDAVLLKEVSRIEKHVGDEIDIVIADGRYGFIHGLARDVIRRDVQIRKSVSNALDRVMLNRVLGIPLFLVMMFVVFWATVRLGQPFIHLFDHLVGAVLVQGLGEALRAISVPAFWVTLMADGIGGGIQTVSTFIPPIFLIFVFLSILEDSGYMARAAFVMDRLLRAVGLPGKAFLPMLVGFGCNVPAILAARTLENERDRIMTILINPFMSCGARLPVYTLFAVAFFPRHGSAVVFSLYLVGMLLGILTGLLLKCTILRGEVSTFVMELPPYHLPTLNGILYHTWNKLKCFIWRAGRVIVAIAIVMSLLNAWKVGEPTQADGAPPSVLQAAGRAVTPFFAPMGIVPENWPAVVALCSGVFAKEAVIGALDTLYAQMNELDGDHGAVPAGLNAATVSSIRARFGSSPSAYAYLLFVLIYAPCIAAMAAIYRETNLKWMLFEAAYLTGLAWVVATAFYQAATFASHPGQATAWLLACAAVLALFWTVMRLVPPRWGHGQPDGGGQTCARCSGQSAGKES